MDHLTQLERRRARDREKAQLWRKRNPDAAKASQAKYRRKNRERRAEENRSWCEENKDLRNQQRRERYQKDSAYRAKILERQRQARAAAPHKSRAYKIARLKSDPVYRLQHSIGVQMRDAIGRNKGGRSWQALVGYSADQLRAHLEAQFEAWMSWENYGKRWHIDHIRPIASFDLTAPGQIEACWALSNLRPLCAVENMRKKHRVFAPLTPHTSGT